MCLLIIINEGLLIDNNSYTPKYVKIYTDGNIVYKSIKPLNIQLMLWSPERALNKIWRWGFVKHDFSFILSTEEKFLSLCEQIETQEVIDILNNSSRINTGDSSKKSGTDIGCSSSMPHSEGRSKG